MYIELNAVQNTHVRIEIVNGLIHYIHTQQTVILDNVHVNDGKWHYLETRWLASELIITLDYGLYRKQSPMDDWVVGLSVAQVYVGGQRHQSSNIVLDGLVGCIKNVRLGSSANARLHDPVEHNIEPGCHVEDACRADVGLCPQHSFCVDLWADHECTCQPGYIGQNCESICITANPCHEGSTCRPDRSSSDGYVCDCPQNQYGQYCEHTLTPTCPTSWWGTPICGPCNCPRDKGFSSSCNKQTGECVCKTNHYRPEGSDTCYPCDCYNIGSHKRLCDVVTGQCRCREGVIGRKCDTCYSKFAEVTLRGCEVIYDSCPRAFSQDIWWERTVFNELAAQSCPTGATGFATRNCAAEGWLSVDKSGCLSQEFVDIQRRLLQLENGDITMNTYVSKGLMQDLEEATNRSAPLGKTKTFYLADINVTYHVVIHVLSYESRQAGLNLTHTQDRNFIQNLVTSVSRILDPDNNHLWNRMQTTDQASVNLMNSLEIYSQVLAKNMAQLFTQPFDAVDDNLVLGLDYAVKSGNLSSVSVPKFNNKVLNDAMFDSNTNIEIPISILEESGPMTEPGVLAEFSYVMYKTLGGVMPKSYHESIMESDVRMILNAPIFTLNVVNGNKTLHGVVDQPVLVHFKQFQAENRSSPQCAYWNPEDSVWTSEGCSVLERQVQGSHHYITCECSHLSTFGLIMDQSNVERMESSTIAVEIITYICVIIALVCLLITLILMCVLRGLHTNSNSIHINLIFVTFVANTLFLTGINQTHDQLGCTVVSIFLHYFFMSVFAWLFVETLHIYRMMTEIRDINHGSMKFYYVVGYVIPGIITGLAVGLSTDAYGNDEFCWLKTSDILIWSFIGPICFVIGLNIVVCAMTLRASCNSKKGDDIFARLKYLMRAVFILLPLLGASWVFALLSVNKDVLAYHYLFALFTLLQGIFIILAYVLFHKQLRQELIWRCQGKSNLDDTLGETRTGILSHSSLAYHHNNSSLEGGLNRLQFPVSTNSTTSKSSTLGGVYEGGYYPSNSTSTSGNPYVPDIQRRGYNSSSMFHDIGPNDRDMVDVSKRHKHHSHKHHNGRHAGRESDSDSELSAMEQTDMDLASSHSSDEYDNDSGRWGQRPKQKVFDRVRKQASPPQVLRIASNPLSQTPSAEPPSYNDLTPTKIPLWPGEAFSTTTISDSEGKNTPQTTPTKKPMLSPNKLNIMNSSPSPRSPLSVKGSQDILIPPADRQDSLQSAVNSGSESCTDNKVKVHERDRDRVQVLTHNGSFSESEIHDLSMQDNTETTV